MKTAVVTGSAGGLGRALAVELARRGAAVVVSDVDAAGQAETVGLIEAAGGRAVGIGCDVTDPEAVQALFDGAIEALGSVDLWVNNAGVGSSGYVGEQSLEDWRWTVDINLWGVVYGCHVVLPYMKARGSGAVLNVASSAGLVSTPGMAAYNATKASVVALTETLRAELVGSGVAVTVLCPTFFQTGILKNGRVEGGPAKMAAKLMARSPMTAEDVAKRALDDLKGGWLYSVPMADGRWMWRLKRLMPGWFATNFGWITMQVAKRTR